MLIFLILWYFLCRWKTLYMSLSNVWMALRPIRRTDPSHQKTHRSQTVPLHSVWAQLRQIWSPGPPHQEAWAQKQRQQQLKKEERRNWWEMLVARFASWHSWKRRGDVRKSGVVWKRLKWRTLNLKRSWCDFITTIFRMEMLLSQWQWSTFFALSIRVLILKIHNCSVKDQITHCTYAACVLPFCLHNLDWMCHYVDDI